MVAFNDEQRGLKTLEDGTALAALLAAFAPVLLNTDDLRIEYNGTTLDPKREIEQDTTLEVPYNSAGQEYVVHVRLIEWKSISQVVRPSA